MIGSLAKEAAGRRSIKSRFVEIKTNEELVYIIPEFIKAVRTTSDYLRVYFMDHNGSADIELQLKMSIDDFWNQIEEQEKDRL